MQSSRCGRYKCEGVCALPGEISDLRIGEVSRGHISPEDYLDEGLNLRVGLMEELLTKRNRVAEVSVEILTSHFGGIVRQTRDML